MNYTIHHISYNKIFANYFFYWVRIPSAEVLITHLNSKEKHIT